jgi:Carboxylesterase family
LGLEGLPGALHGDNSFYLYHLNLAIPVLPSDEAFLIQRRYVRMFTNFFKYGNPTPTLRDPLVTAQWPILTQSEQFMDIGRSSKPDFHPFQDRMDIWHAFDQRFNPV